MNNHQMAKAFQQQNQMMMLVMKNAGMMTDEQFKQLNGGMQQKHDVFPLHHDAPDSIHEHSFFQDCTLERSICNATIQPVFSLLNWLPAFGDNVETKSYGMMTDFATDTTGTRPDEPCEQPELVEDAYNFCKIRFPRGRRDLRGKTMEIDELIRIACTCFSDDYFLLEGMGPREAVDGLGAPGSTMFTPNDRNLITEAAVRRQIANITMQHQLWMANNVWTGDPTNNTANGGYKEFLGLDLLYNCDPINDPILSPYIESMSGDINDCAYALTPDCKDFGGYCINDPLAPYSIFQLLQEMEQVLWQRAMRSGMLPVSWVLVMPSWMFEALAKVLPCQMSTDGCVTLGEGSDIAQGQVILNQGDNFLSLDMRQQILSSMSINLNGRSLRVIFDDFMPYDYDAADNQYRGKIMMIPEFVGNRRTLWIEYADYSAIGAALAPLPGSQTDMLGWSDGGRYHWVIKAYLRCFELLSKIEPRLVARCPFLAGMIENIVVCPIQSRPLPDTNTTWNRNDVDIIPTAAP